MEKKLPYLTMPTTSNWQFTKVTLSPWVAPTPYLDWNIGTL